MDDTAPLTDSVSVVESFQRPVERLKRRGDFLRVAGYGRKWVTPGFILQAAPQPKGLPKNSPTDRLGRAQGTEQPARVGFTVSRKVGKAVVRNRARRRLRAAVDMVFPEAAHAGWDFVLIGRRETNDRVFAALVRDLRTALDRLDPSRPAPGGDRKGGGRSSGKGRGKGAGKGQDPTTGGGGGSDSGVRRRRGRSRPDAVAPSSATGTIKESSSKDPSRGGQDA